jgi:hypothetical protein
MLALEQEFLPVSVLYGPVHVFVEVTAPKIFWGMLKIFFF